MRLLWLFVILLFVEIALFIQIGGLIGVLPTLALIVLSSFAGIWVMRTQGANAINRLQRSLQEMGDPGVPMARGAMNMTAGMLLFLPGFFTSALGLLLLIPPLQQLLMRRMGARVKVTRSGFGYHQQGPGADYVRPRSGAEWNDTVIDAEYTVTDAAQDGPGDADEDAGKPSRRGNSGWTRH